MFDKIERYLIAVATFIIIVLVASLCHSATTTYSGEVTRIMDGDTIHVTDNDNNVHKIRLAGIDAPEIDQPYGMASKEALNAILKYRPVRVEIQGTDKYQREIAKIYSKDADISAFMLRYGLAWHYSYFDSNQSYAELEKIARREHLGLWQTDDNIAPWVWRREKGIRSKRS